MSTWNQFLEDIENAIGELRCDETYFRGHSDSLWKLEPSLAREKRTNPRYNSTKEKRLFWDFRMLGSHLLPSNPSEWDVLYYMQHHGVPTRLLDWTTSFSTALYFAMKSPQNQIAVWVLNPYSLNEITSKECSVSNLNVSFKMDYCAFIDLNPKPAGALAVAGDSSVGRIHAQGGAFTLHANLDQPLEELYPSVVRKITLDRNAYPQATRFLGLAGTNEYTVFPDLDGLARYLVQKELGVGDGT